MRMASSAVCSSPATSDRGTRFQQRLETLSFRFSSLLVNSFGQSRPETSVMTQSRGESPGIFFEG
jgi:hypothetical protein